VEAALIALKILVPLAYITATVLFARLFFSPEENRFAGKANLALSTALALHTLLLVTIGLQLKRCPLGTVGEGLLFLAWILAVIQLMSERLADTRRLGLFTLLPTALCVVIGVFMVRPDFALPPELRSSLLVFHIVASLASYACFSMAAILSSLYLILHGKLKHKNFDITFRKLPPLGKLDKLSANWSFLGSATMVLSSVIGWIWVRKDGIEGMNWRELAIYLVLAVFLGAGISRKLFGLRGKRYAIVVLVGFLVLLMTNLFGTHGFHN
jgi:HemX protein